MINSSNTASPNVGEFTADVKSKMAFGNNGGAKDERQQQHSYQHDCDILLNNFQIKKQRYKVLLHYDHIVWERLDAKDCANVKKIGNAEKSSGTAAATKPASNNAAAAAAQKEAEYEREQLSHKAIYGSSSNVVHLREVIRVSKGSTKSATVRNAHNPLETFEETQNRRGLTPTEQYLSIYYAERIVSSATDCNRWHIRRLTLHNNDPYVVAKWYDSLQKSLRLCNKLRIRRLLVFINPYGGRKMGLQIYERSCKPTIQLAGIDASCIITQRANQIRDILMSHDLTPYDAVCCVGGDGTVAEMINGLILRAMQDQGEDLRKPTNIPKPSLPIGIIPAGSTDTIAYSLHGTADVQTAAIHLVLGQRRGLDVCSVRNRDGIVRFCTSVMGYGYLGDVAAKSEKYRWMGTKRYEYTGVKSFLLNRGYEAEVHMLLSNDESEIDASTSDITPTEDVICNVNCERCKFDPYITPPSIDNEKPTTSNTSLNTNQTNGSHGDTSDEISKKHSSKSHVENQNEKHDDNKTTHENYLDPASRTLPNDDNIQKQTNGDFPSPGQAKDVKKWRIVHGEFFMITGSNITCACSRSPNGISKYCHLGDGHLDVMLVRKTNLLNNVRFALNTMGRDGDIRNLPFVETYRTKEFIFKAKPKTCLQDYNSIRGSCQPINDSIAGTEVSLPEKLFSSWNCDGEVVSDLEITMISHRQLIDVFMRGPYIYSKPFKNTNSKSIFCCCHTDS